MCVRVGPFGERVMAGMLYFASSAFHWSYRAQAHYPGLHNAWAPDLRKGHTKLGMQHEALWLRH